MVRTLDGGADKPLRFLPTPAEQNPALGERGLRLFRRAPEVMDVQLRALATVAVPELQVMAPMVATAEEATWFARECADKGLLDVGVMIEIPAAALRAADVISQVDFVSVGTNDLSQYAFAADRGLGAVSGLHDPWQPGLLDLVALVAEAASRAGKPCGVCGEAAADAALACVLAGLGASTLSMAPSALAGVRAGLAAHTLEQCRTAAQAARAQPSAADARAAARVHLPGLARLGL
ncbi:hypothetical protein GCM10020001_061640 [Nonomuraea salmonea]